jgi:hypothetical protein
VPAGACVFRLWGVNAACYPAGGTFFTGSCAELNAEPVHVSPGSYYDGGGGCGVAPGCPSAEPYAFDPGAWWYFGNSGVENGATFTDLVICAPECANSFALAGGCLRLRTKSSR